MTRIYEELFIVKPDAPDEEVDAFVETIKTQLTTAGATVDKVDKWGKRRLAYEINKNADGIYAVVEVTCEPATVAELDRQLGLNESVLRTKVLRIERKRVPAAAS